MICSRTDCTKSALLASWFCSDNCQSAWHAARWGIEQFPAPAYVPAQVLPRWRETPFSWLDGS